MCLPIKYQTDRVHPNNVHLQTIMHDPHKLWILTYICKRTQTDDIKKSIFVIYII
ncbi:hypothetical protein BgiMline_024745, partial [Biomphalaria glabrata]